MARDFTDVLQQAMEFYVAGQIVEARALLLDVVRADSKLEAGWMFLSYTLEEPRQKADCLRKVLALNPNNAEAQAALQKLESVLQEGPKAPTTTAELIQAAAQAPSETDGLIHAAPFTVDIDHATDDISFAGEVPAPGSGSLAEFPPMPVAPKAPAAAASSPAPAPAPQPRPTPPAAPQSVSAEPVVPPRSVPAAPAVQPAAVTAAVKAAKPAATPPTLESAKPVPTAVHAKPASKETAEVKEKPKKKGGFGCTCATVIIVLALIVVGGGVGLWATGNLPAGLLPVQVTQEVSPTPGITNTPPPQITLPAEWTKTLTPTITLTPTVTDTPTLTHTPTLAPPDPTTQADISRLIKEVEDLRGLEMDEEIPVYVVDLGQAETILQAELDQSGYREIVQNEAKALSILGFIKPTYDLAKYALTRLADGVMGFYMPSNRTIYIIGNRFAGMERWTFTHEYDHALVHHFYPAAGIMDDDPICANDTQRCEAIRALVEGDAMLIMVQWLDQYASPYDIRDIELYPYPFLLPPEQNTPPYVTPLVEFSYYAGLNFVGSLWSLGNWARVNQIYNNLPVSTEQILHPQKYLDGEKPIMMKVPKLANLLGETWTLVESDSLGEFMSYLLLAYGADNLAQISTETAKTATEGWGGDHYLVFSASGGDQLLLAVEWVWDTSADATQFLDAMKSYLDKRYRGQMVSPAPGDCWGMNQQTTCLFHSGKGILWVIAPDLDLVRTVRSAYSSY